MQFKWWGRRSAKKDKAILPVASPLINASPVDGRGGWWTVIRESFTGAWQQNVEINADTVAAYWAVFSCITLIASDIAKMTIRVMQRMSNTGVWKETFLRPVLRKPNRFQTRLEFITQWVLSKLLTGNTYILKVRDERGFVAELYVLDPRRVLPLVTEEGAIFYQLARDNLSLQLDDSVVVPASEIIHDKMYPLYHPLVGISPLYACSIPAMQGSAIQGNSAKFFQNMSRPSGILTAPGAISQETADRLRDKWQENYAEGNVGRVAVLGDGLKYEAMSVTAADAQLIEQLKMTAEMVCACFHVPGYKIGVGSMPATNNTAFLNQQYYDQCLQFNIEGIEQRLDDGLELPMGFEAWFDTSALLRMDPDARYKAHSEAIRGGWKSPNEARKEEELEPVAGGDTPYMQQQNYALSALAKRDEKDDPFATSSPKPSASTEPKPAGEPVPEDEAAKALKNIEQEFEDLRKWREQVTKSVEQMVKEATAKHVEVDEELECEQLRKLLDEGLNFETA